MHIYKNEWVVAHSVSNRRLFMSKMTPEVKTSSRVIGIILKAADFNTRSMEVETEFTEKEIYKERVRIIRTWKTLDTYNFRMVSREELKELRLNKKIAGLVCKDGNALFYTEIPGSLRLNSSAADFGSHMCGKNCSKVCNGCPRTSDLTVSFQERGGKHFFQAVKDSWRLEKYPFIVSGIEAFNMEGSNDACIVFACKNYQIRYKKERKSTSIADAKLGIAHYIWEDFHGNREEMKERIRRNMDKNRDYLKLLPD